MHKSGTISRRRVAELIRPYHIKQLTSDTIDQEVFDKLDPFCCGVSVLPRSAVSARVYFTGEAALKAKSMGEKVCLCKTTFVPTDTVVMREMDAIISLTSAAIHVVTICHSLGIPALLSLEKNGVDVAAGRTPRQFQRQGNPRGRLDHTFLAGGRTLYHGRGEVRARQALALHQGRAGPVG